MLRLMSLTKLEHSRLPLVQRAMSSCLSERSFGLQHDTLEIASPVESAGRKFERYRTEQPVSAHSTRLNKATGKFTPLGVCICSDPDEAGAFHDRVPLPIRIDAPISLNAQFDPDGARSTILQNAWNKDRLADLGQFLGAFALYAFNRDPCSAWTHVPLKSEGVEAGDWIRKQFADTVIATCHARLTAALRLPTRSGTVPLSQIVYEKAGLEAVLAVADMEILAPGSSAILPVCRDQGGRWREVLDDLGQSRCLGLADALQLFDHFEHIQRRSPEWFVAMAALGIDHGLWADFAQKNALLLADGRIVVCPTRNGPRVLVRNDNPESLARRLGLALPLHIAYAAETAEARKAVTKLLELKVLRESCDQPIDALQLLARSDEPVE